MIVFWSLFVVVSGLGAALRYQAHHWVVFPWGTLLINILGSFLMGFLWVYLQKSSLPTREIIFVALLGSMTTFSGYSLDIIKLFSEGAPGKAILYFCLSNTVCLLGCFMGWRFAHNLVSPA